MKNIIVRNFEKWNCVNLIIFDYTNLMEHKTGKQVGLFPFVPPKYLCTPITEHVSM